MTRLEVPVQLRWSDLDAYGHVNNAEMLRLLEEARISAFWRHPEAADGTRGESQFPTAVLDAGPTAPVATLIARQEIEYLQPIGYRRVPILIELWLGHLGGASIDVCYEVRDTSSGNPGSTVFARATTTIVLVDAKAGTPVRLDAEAREAWAPYVGEPVEHRRRR